jgi:hypothetical protein
VDDAGCPRVAVAGSLADEVERPPERDPAEEEDEEREGGEEDEPPALPPPEPDHRLK